MLSEELLSANFTTMKLNQISIYLNLIAKKDALKEITLLPYSTTIDKYASLSLWGSDESRSVVLINGVPVSNPVKYSEMN